jgi:hypothetical protein
VDGSGRTFTIKNAFKEAKMVCLGVVGGGSGANEARLLAL